MIRAFALVTLASVGCGRVAFDPRLDTTQAIDAIPDGLPRGQQAHLEASTPDADALFGVVAASDDGQVLAIGAPHDLGSGAAYVFRQSGTTWIEEAYLKAPNMDAGDELGTAVAVSGDGLRVAVGARREDSAGAMGDNSAMDAGAVYVYVHDGASWQLEAYVKATPAVASSLLGNSVALDGSGMTLVAGAPGGAGAAHSFIRTGSTWIETDQVIGSNTEVPDGFGGRVALSRDGTSLAVGAVGEASNARGIDGSQSNNLATNAGAVYVFAAAGIGTWMQQAYVKGSNTSAFDSFGQSLALSADGSTLVVGAAFEDSASTGIDSEQENDNAGNAGAAFAYTRTGTTWSQQAYIKPSRIAGNDQFGTSVTIGGDGNTLAIGAIGASGDAGATTIFTRMGTTWMEQDMLMPGLPGDLFGSWLAITADGRTLFVGAPYENGAAGDSGAVYVFGL